MTFQFFHADQLASLPRLSWIVDRELPEQGFSVLYGPPGCYKSFVALDYALHIAQRDSVVYVTPEGRDGMEARVAAWCDLWRRGRGQLAFCFDAINVLDAGAGGSVELFIQAAAQYAPRLIVLDTLHRMLIGGSDSSDLDMGLFVRAVDQIRSCLGCAVLVLHHTNKSGDYRGSSALLGAADSFMRVRSDRPGRVTISSEKSKDGESGPLRTLAAVKRRDSLVMLPARLVIGKNAGGDRLSENQATILRFACAGIHESGFKHGDVVGGTDVPRGSVTSALDALVQRGYIGQDGKTFAATPEGRAYLDRQDRELESKTLTIDGELIELPAQLGDALAVPPRPERPTPPAPRYSPPVTRPSAGTGWRNPAGYDAADADMPLWDDEPMPVLADTM